MKTIEITAGQNTFSAAQTAIDAAKACGEGVQFVFNGTSIVASSESCAYDLVEIYYLKHELAQATRGRNEN